MVHTSNLATWEAEIRRIVVQGQAGQQEWDAISKIPNVEKGWWSGQVVEHLSSHHEAMSSNPSAEKKKILWNSCYIFSNYRREMEA
jgi:hypothetical protein